MSGHPTAATSSKEAFWELRHYIDEMADALERGHERGAADIIDFASDEGLDDVAMDLLDAREQYTVTFKTILLLVIPVDVRLGHSDVRKIAENGAAGDDRVLP